MHTLINTFFWISIGLSTLFFVTFSVINVEKAPGDHEDNSTCFNPESLTQILIVTGPGATIVVTLLFIVVLNLVSLI